MQISMSQHFPCSPEDLWAMFDDPVFANRVSQRTGAARELAEERTDARGKYLRWSVARNTELPAIVKKMIGADRLRYEIECWRPTGEPTQTWKVIPMVLADRVVGAGTNTVRAAEGGCVLEVEGKVEVKVPVVGKQIEQMLAAVLEASGQHYAAEVQEALKLRQSPGTGA